jgi:ribonuclease VapC
VPDAEPASILDASALIALLHDEPGTDAVVDAITATAAVSVVNWAETLSKVAADGADPQQVADSFQASNCPLLLEPLTDADCIEIARLRPLTKARGLSLADRARHLAARPTRACPVYGRPPKGPRAVYCSRSCRDRAYRTRHRSGESPVRSLLLS